MDSASAVEPSHLAPGATGAWWPAIGDDELERLALAADPDEPVAPDATPLSPYPGGDTVLPDWYIAPVRVRRLAGWHRVVIVAVIGAFLLIEAVGLCSTYGQPPLH
jgi:hypothetical protein